MTRRTRKGLVFSSGGSCLRGGSACIQGICALPQTGGADIRIGALFPHFGGNRTKKQKKQIGRGCGCGQKQLMMALPKNVMPSQELLKGGGCGCGEVAPAGPWKNLTGGGCGCTRFTVPIQQGGACPCQAASPFPVALGGAKRRGGYKHATHGGYRPTKRNLKYLKKWKCGESIGFTMRSSLKAKGLIPRADGTYRVSPKYQHTK